MKCVIKDIKTNDTLLTVKSTLKLPDDAFTICYLIKIFGGIDAPIDDAEEASNFYISLDNEPINEVIQAMNDIRNLDIANTEMVECARNTLLYLKRNMKGDIDTKQLVEAGSRCYCMLVK